MSEPTIEITTGVVDETAVEFTRRVPRFYRNWLVAEARNGDRGPAGPRCSIEAERRSRHRRSVVRPPRPLGAELRARDCDRHDRRLEAQLLPERRGVRDPVGRPEPEPAADALP